VISSPKDRREQEGYQNSGSSVKIAGVTSLVSILLPAPSPRVRHFAIPFPIAKTPGARSSNGSTCAKDLATSLRSGTRQGLDA